MNLPTLLRLGKLNKIIKRELNITPTIQSSNGLTFMELQLPYDKAPLLHRIKRYILRLGFKIHLLFMNFDDQNKKILIFIHLGDTDGQDM